MGIWQLGCKWESQESEINSVGSFCLCGINMYFLNLYVTELHRLLLVHLISMESEKFNNINPVSWQQVVSLNLGLIGQTVSR